MGENKPLSDESIKAIEAHGGRFIERYSFLERLAHFSHLAALFVLLITGFKINFGWDFIAYHTALVYHMIFAILFMIANWVIIPYNILTMECPRCEACEAGGHNIYLHRAAHIVRRYIFGLNDAKKVKQILLYYAGKAEYPAYNVYDVKNKGYLDKIHPITKFLLFFEGIAVALVFFTGIVLYDLQFSVLGFPLSQWLLSIGDIAAPYVNLGSLALMRTVHLMIAYFFIAEVIIHVGIVEFDPKVWKYHKAIFWTGKGDLGNLDYVELINVENDSE